MWQPPQPRLAFDKGVGLAVRERQRLDREQPLGVLAGEVLFGLLFVAGLAGGDGRQLGLGGVVHAGVALAVAVGAAHGLGHHPPVEVLDDHRCQLGVAVFALGLHGRGRSDPGQKHHDRCHHTQNRVSAHHLLLHAKCNVRIIDENRGLISGIAH